MYHTYCCLIRKEGIYRAVDKCGIEVGIAVIIQVLAVWKMLKGLLFHIGACEYAYLLAVIVGICYLFGGAFFGIPAAFAVTAQQPQCAPCGKQHEHGYYYIIGSF